MCPTDLEKELTAQQHVFSGLMHKLEAHIVPVINCRTRGLAPMIGNLSDEDSNHHAISDESVECEDDGELYRMEIRNGKKVVTKSRPDPSKRQRREGTH